MKYIYVISDFEVISHLLSSCLGPISCHTLHWYFLSISASLDHQVCSIIYFFILLNHYFCSKPSVLYDARVHILRQSRRSTQFQFHEKKLKFDSKSCKILNTRINK